jgi:protoporphyrin/coproporphyrin ferrochelatase
MALQQALLPMLVMLLLQHQLRNRVSCMSSTDNLPPCHPSVKHGKVGVVLINLGTPDAPTPSAVRRYLAEFLSDKRVVELPALLWQPILRGIILAVRPRKTAKLYQHIWDNQSNSLPLKANTQAQTAALQSTWGKDVVVTYAMRYGNPSIASVLDQLRAQGCDRLLIAPLYPQYSMATTGTVLAAVFDHLSKRRWMPAVRTLPPYYDDPAHIEALAESIKSHLAGLDFKPDAVLASFHGMPQVTLAKGDPYHCQCQKSARLLREALGASVSALQLSFQSRFGKQTWLQPYSIDVVRRLPSQGIKSIAVVAPGFSVDCLETLEEIQSELHDAFVASGGERFTYIPCLNASPVGMDMLQRIIARELAGWI